MRTLVLFAAAHDVAVRTVPNRVSLIVALAGLGLSAPGGQFVQALFGAVLVFGGTRYCWRRGWISRVYSAGGTTSYVVGVATSPGVIIIPAMVSLNNVATRGGADGFSKVSVNYNFGTVAPALLKSLTGGFAVPACFPNNG
jgi:hypothetical protein